ncbi:MAG: hypothetical protein GF355_00760, partial [Candidatus Eisenbacteria bacterium]|nr:hypothetical protein [Candidatus Eisenbacteria bacterium]
MSERDFRDRSSGPETATFPAPWAHDASPWGIVWEEVAERPEWHRLFPEHPPFSKGSFLKLRVLRQKPEAVPRVLRGPEPWPGNLLTSPLARLMDEGSEGATRRLQAVTT